MEKIKAKQKEETRIYSMSERIWLEGYKEGYKEGYEEGCQKVRQEWRLEICRQMAETLLSKTDLSVEKISRITYCPLNTVKKIKADIEAVQASIPA